MTVLGHHPKNQKLAQSHQYHARDLESILITTGEDPKRYKETKSRRQRVRGRKMIDLFMKGGEYTPYCLLILIHHVVSEDGRDPSVSPDAHRSDREKPPPGFEDGRLNTSPAQSDMEDQREIGEPEPDTEDRGEIEDPGPEFEREPSVQEQFETRPSSPQAPSNLRAPESVVLGSINPSATPSQKMLLRRSSWYGHSDGRSTVAALSNAGDRPMSLIRSMSSRSSDRPSRNRSVPVPMSDIVYQSRAPSTLGDARQHHNIEGLTGPMRFETPVPMIAEYLQGMPRHVQNGEIDEMEMSYVGTHQD
jgi:hypothetical protein